MKLQWCALTDNELPVGDEVVVDTIGIVDGNIDAGGDIVVVAVEPTDNGIDALDTVLDDDIVVDDLTDVHGNAVDVNDAVDVLVDGSKVDATDVLDD